MCVSLMLYKEALCSFVQLFNSYPFPVEKSSWLLPINVFAVGSVYAGSLNNLGQLLLSKYDVFVVVVCLALLLKGAAAKVIEELEWVKRNINVFRIKEKKHYQKTVGKAKMKLSHLNYGRFIYMN